MADQTSDIKTTHAHSAAVENPSELAQTELRRSARDKRLALKEKEHRVVQLSQIKSSTNT